jgi:hypothetical protein
MCRRTLGAVIGSASDRTVPVRCDLIHAQRRSRRFSPSHRGSLDGASNLLDKPADSKRHTSYAIDDASDERRNEFKPVKSRADHPQLPDKKTHQDRVDHREDNVDYEEVAAGSIHALAPFRLHAAHRVAFV